MLYRNIHGIIRSTSIAPLKVFSRNALPECNFHPMVMPTDAARFTNIARLVHLNQSRSGNGDLGNILSAGKAGRVIDKSGNGETIKDEVIEW